MVTVILCDGKRSGFRVTKLKLVSALPSQRIDCCEKEVYCLTVANGGGEGIMVNRVTENIEFVA